MLADPGLETAYIAFIFLGFTASIISAIFGFGTALIVLALGTYLLPVKETIVLATVLFAASTVTKSFLYARHINWQITAIMAFASLPFAYLGASFLDDMPAEWLRRLLGCMILLYLTVTVFKWMPQFRIGKKGLVAGSAVYGFISGLLGSGNVVKVILFREMSIEKEAFVGAMAATSVLSNIAKLTAYQRSELLAPNLVLPIIFLVISSITAAFAGKYLLAKIPPSQFGIGIQVILAISAAGLLI